MSADAVVDDVGVVVIGRNEGERLARCLASVLHQVPPNVVLYVDSQSTDASIDIAYRDGVAVISLDSRRELSAARARNEGFRALSDRLPNLAFVQFVDGDCELHREWIDEARSALLHSPRVAIVCGVLRERHPQRSIYNRLCEMEWAGAAGEIQWCGGVFMMRADVFRVHGGFRSTMLAGEEPELCARIRRDGWLIERLNVEMANHDADMHRFIQWWRRAVRSGRAWAERACLHGRRGDPASVRHMYSIAFWSILLPMLIILPYVYTGGASALLAAAYPAQWMRMALAKRRVNYRWQDATLYALFTILAKWAQVVGVVRFLISRINGSANQRIRSRAESEPAIPAGTTAGRES